MYMYIVVMAMSMHDIVMEVVEARFMVLIDHTCVVWSRGMFGGAMDGNLCRSHGIDGGG